MSNQSITAESQIAWLRSAIINPIKDKCILWPWKPDRGGYGRFMFEGKRESVHRIAYKLHYGDYPDPCGLHECDVRACLNPLHIRPGSRRENNQERARKGRNGNIKGVAHPLTNFTENDIRDIRRLYDLDKISQVKIGKMFGITQACVSQIVLRKSWCHVE